MKIDNTLQLLISLAVIYFLLSNLVSMLFEWYAYKTQKRGKLLYKGIIDLLNDPVNRSYGASVYSHYQIEKLKKDKDSAPQYISASLFSDAFIDVIGQQATEISYKNIKDKDGNVIRVEMNEQRHPDPFARFKLGVARMQYSPLKELLRAFYEKSNDYNELKVTIGSWYDDYTERMSGWYKVSIKKTLFFFGLAVSLFLNVDSIRLIKTLNTDDALRQSLVDKADSVAKIKAASTQTVSINQIQSALEEVSSASLPIGWNIYAVPLCFKGMSCLQSIFAIIFWMLGILISAAAISFGAPFWFDVLGNLVNLRRAGIKPDRMDINTNDKNKL